MHVRKVSPEEAATWRRLTHRPDPAELAALLAQFADRRGITRIDIDGPAGGEHAWRARVYTRGVELHKQFADSLYGGPAGSLREALAWRDSMRKVAGCPPPRAGYTPRIVRAEYHRQCGWLAYAPYAKRYFADSAHGGREAAYATAQAWQAEVMTQEQPAGIGGDGALTASH